MLSPALRIDQSNARAMPLFWLAGCALLCPLAGGVTELALDPLWETISPLARRSVVVLPDNLIGFGSIRRHVAELLGAFYVAAVAAIALAASLGLAQPTWMGRFDQTAALYPACIAVMAAPAAVVFAHYVAFGGAASAGRVSSGYLTLYASFAVAIAVAYTLWVHLYRATHLSPSELAPNEHIRLWV